MRITPRSILAAVLLVFVAASVGYLAAGWLRPAAPGSPASPPQGHVVVAWWLYWRPSCADCEAVRTYTRETLEADFAAALAAGRLEWRTADTADPSHAHLAQAFHLVTKSVVLAEYRNGQVTRWRNLAAVWDLIADRPAFQAYVRDEVGRFLSEVQW